MKINLYVGGLDRFNTGSQPSGRGFDTGIIILHDDRKTFGLSDRYRSMIYQFICGELLKVQYTPGLTACQVVPYDRIKSYSGDLWSADIGMVRYFGSDYYESSPDNYDQRWTEDENRLFTSFLVTVIRRARRYEREFRLLQKQNSYTNIDMSR